MKFTDMKVFRKKCSSLTVDDTIIVEADKTC